MAHYSPPRQGKASQLFDVVVLVVLTVGALFVPLWMGLAGAAKSVANPVANPTWATLGQNAAQAAKYEALGYTPETAHDLILSRFDYSFSLGALVAMVAVIVLYYVLILRFSEVEYREVISEKFGEKSGE
jgi:cytochrome c-type biogenesis protein CcmH/NrfG